MKISNNLSPLARTQFTVYGFVRTTLVVCSAVVGQGDVYPRGCVPSGMCTLGDVYPRNPTGSDVTKYLTTGSDVITLISCRCTACFPTGSDVTNRK